MEFDWMPMNEELITLLKAKKNDAVNEWVFTQSVGRHKDKPYKENRGFPQSLCEAAEVQPFGCHGIRHLAGSRLAQDGTPMVGIKTILRHQNVHTTEQYVRGMESVRPYLEKLSEDLKRT